jgi:hypothetical protein
MKLLLILLALPLLAQDSRTSLIYDSSIASLLASQSADAYTKSAK